MRALLASLLLAAALLVPPVQAQAPAQAWVWSDPAGNADRDRLLATLERLDLPSHTLDALGMVTFAADARTARAVHQLAGGRLDANAFLDLHLDESVPYIGADTVKRSLGPQPNGPTVLVVDTGIDSSHPDFEEGRNLAANAQPVRANGLTVGSQEDGAVVDEAGHGTHVAGVVAGSGESLGDEDPLHGRYTGAYAIGRVASYKASSTEEGQESKVEVIAALEAFEWALDNQERYNLRAVTNSWGERGEFDAWHPVAQATKRLYLAGMVVVFSAGNNGEEGPGTLNRYCVAPWVLCVAAGDLNGTRQPFSSEGTDDPARPWDHPDLMAPGLFITSTRPPARPLLTPIPGLQGLPGTDPEASRELYDDRSGTSIAAPHVAATAAALQAANPALSPDDVMDILVSTARPMDEPVAQVGAGELDALASYRTALHAQGTRDAFLAGETVRYAGAASGDAANAQDPVSVDASGQDPSGGLLPRDERLWIASPVAIVLLVLALALVVAGTRSRVA